MRFLEHAHVRKYPAKSNIIYYGDVSNTLYLVKKGQVAVFIENDDEREIIISYLNRNDFFGELGIFNTDKQMRSAGARARVACEIAEISYKKFHELFDEDQEMIDLINSQINQRLRDTTVKLSNLAFLDVAKRVKQTLIHLCEQPNVITHPQGYQLKITRQEIGHIANCSREMVGRIIKNLEEEKFLMARGKTMVIFERSLKEKIR